jgi:hypothetical protein
MPAVKNFFLKTLESSELYLNFPIFNFETKPAFSNPDFPLLLQINMHILLIFKILTIKTT